MVKKLGSPKQAEQFYKLNRWIDRKTKSLFKHSLLEGVGLISLLPILLVFLTFWVFLFILSIPSTKNVLFAQSSDGTGDNDSWRELCRTKTSGRWLSLRDEYQFALGSFQSAEKELAKLDRAIETAEARKDQIEKDLRSTGQFNPKLHTDKIYHQEKLKSLQSQRVLNAEMVVETSARVSDRKSAFEEFAAKVKPVFKVVEAGSQKQGGQGRKSTKLDYNNGCSEYRFACPLPIEPAIALSKMFSGEPESDPCIRYARLSGAGK